MAVPFTPILNSGISYLTNYQEMLVSFIQFFILSPGNLSSYNEEEYSSFRILAAKYQDNKDYMCEMVRASIYNSLTKLFPQFSTYVINVTHRTYGDNELEYRYILSIEIYFKDSNGIIHAGISSKDFIVESDGHITVTYNNES